MKSKLYFVAFFAVSSTTLLYSAQTHAQQVASLDSGIDSNIGLNLGTGFNYIANNGDTNDLSTRQPDGHGNQSGRAITESFSGQIVPFVIVDGDGSRLGSALTVARDRAFTDIVNRSEISVVALSRSGRGLTDSSSSVIPQLSAANKLVAIMAGNDGQAQPNVLSRSSAGFAGVIIVGGGDANGNLLAASNRAGGVADRYVVANGLPFDGVGTGGSSWATARIGGIAGAVLLQNPNLTAEQVVDIIFRSAEDRGAAGTDAEFGRGFIRNAAQVLNNVIGPVVVPDDNGGGSGGGGIVAGALVVGGAVAGALLWNKKRSKKLEQTLVLDSYGRGFHLDLGEQISINESNEGFQQFFNSFSQRGFTQQVSIPKLRTRIAYSASTNYDATTDIMENYGAPSKNDALFGNEVENSVAYSFASSTDFSDQWNLFAGYQIDAQSIYGADNLQEQDAFIGGGDFVSGQSFGSLLSGFANKADTLNLSFSPKNTPKLSLQMGLVSVNQADNFGLDSRSSIAQGKYQWNEFAAVGLQVGQLKENGSLLGGASGGVLGVDNTTTYVVNVMTQINLSTRFKMLANYGVGRSFVKSASGGAALLKSFSTLDSQWFSLGVKANALFTESDSMGIAFSQPLKVTKGDALLSIPQFYRADGSIHFDRENIDFSQTGVTEKDFEAYYRTKIGDKMELGGFFVYRQNPYHSQDAKDDFQVMATLRYRTR